MPAEPTTMIVDGVSLDLELVRKNVKNVNARLRGKRLLVSAPYKVSQAELEVLIRRLARRLIRRARADEVNADQVADTIARKVARRFPKPPKVTAVCFVTTQQARWGSYSMRTGIVRLSAPLRLMPTWVLEAVVAHELAHSFFPNHSAAFWKLLRSVCPQTDRSRTFLEGVTWLASSWEKLPPVERSLLARAKVDTAS